MRAERKRLILRTGRDRTFGVRRTEGLRLRQLGIRAVGFTRGACASFHRETGTPYRCNSPRMFSRCFHSSFSICFTAAFASGAFSEAAWPM
jgi:hypothetical protein